MTYTPPKDVIKDKDTIKVDCLTGKITNMRTGKMFQGNPFSLIQQEIYSRGGLLAQECQRDL